LRAIGCLSFLLWLNGRRDADRFGSLGGESGDHAGHCERLKVFAVAPSQEALAFALGAMTVDVNGIVGSDLALVISPA
jgi:hypothetical protein